VSGFRIATLALVLLPFPRPVEAQQISLVPAPRLIMPGESDSNSPAVRWQGQLVLFNSNGMPVRSVGPDIENLRGTHAVIFDRYDRVFRWIESAWTDADGTVYAWYHHEPGGICGGFLTAPEIGALVSFNGGRSFFDLGTILSDGYQPDCGTSNGYFAGGHGDFSVIVDRENRYFYFLFGNYGGPAKSQGVAIARLPFEFRADPVGRVEKYFEGAWNEPGIGGNVTPVFRARAPWNVPETDSFWGPAIHFNRALGQYVVLLSRSCCEPYWPQVGVYAAFTSDLSRPESWTEPVKILEDVSWYPQIIGLDADGTDTEAGADARLFIFGISDWFIRFTP
jgi:hypothetical protein